MFVKQETRNNLQFHIKLKPELSDGKLTICSTSPDKPEEGSTQVMGLKIWLRMEY
jgi:hypothetical protein